MTSSRLQEILDERFNSVVNVLKEKYKVSKSLKLEVHNGKDDDRGHCIMICLIDSSDVWTSREGVSITLWKEDEEHLFEEECRTYLINLANAAGMTSIKM